MRTKNGTGEDYIYRQNTISIHSTFSKSSSLTDPPAKKVSYGYSRILVSIAFLELMKIAPIASTQPQPQPHIGAIDCLSTTMEAILISNVSRSLNTTI
jgi:hypothetical protein